MLLFGFRVLIFFGGGRLFLFFGVTVRGVFFVIQVE
jgi:hypothetical protein